MKAKPLFRNQNVTKTGLAPSEALVEIVQRIVSDLTEHDQGLSAFTALLSIANAGRHFRVSSTGGVDLSPALYQTSDLTITLAGALGPFAHGLGVVPRIVTAFLVNTTAEYGYSIGDVIPVSPVGFAALVVDATNLNVRFGSTAGSIWRKDTGVATAITPGSWRLRVSLWS